MHEILTGFESKIQQLIVAFRFIVFTVMTMGLVAHLSQHHYHSSAIVRPVARALTIVALIASLGWWFPLVERTLLATAEYIDSDYAQNPMRAADTIRESTTPNPDGKSVSFWKIRESIQNAMTDAISQVFILISTLLTGPLLIMQYVLRWILYLLAPFALACFMVPSLQGLGVRFFQQTVAILAWPVGFAITNLVALSIWQDFCNAVNPEPATLTLFVMSPFIRNLGGIIAGLALLIGNLATPLVCQQLFASGSAFTGQSASPATMMRTVSEIHSRISSMMASRFSGSGGAGSAASGGSGGAASSGSGAGSNAGSGNANSIYGAPGTPGSFGASNGSGSDFGGNVNSSPAAFGGQSATTVASTPLPPPPMLAPSAEPDVPGI